MHEIHEVLEDGLTWLAHPCPQQSTLLAACPGSRCSRKAHTTTKQERSCGETCVSVTCSRVLQHWQDLRRGFLTGKHLLRIGGQSRLQSKNAAQWLTKVLICPMTSLSESLCEGSKSLAMLDRTGRSQDESVLRSKFPVSRLGNKLTEAAENVLPDEVLLADSHITVRCVGGFLQRLDNSLLFGLDQLLSMIRGRSGGQRRSPG